MRSPRRSFGIELAGFVLGGLVVAACQPSGGPFEEPVVFPNETYLGSTIALGVDSTHIPVLDGIEDYALTAQNVRLRLRNEAGSSSLDLVPRAVFEGASAATSLFGATPNPGQPLAAGQRGAVLTIAVLDLPPSLDPAFGAFPQRASLTLLRRQGQSWVESVAVKGRVQILGPRIVGGSPATNYVNFTTPTLSQLQTRPRLRIRGRGTPNAFPDVAPLPQIGSIEFELTFPGSVGQLEAIPGAEASLATAVVSSLAPGVARVILVDPKGFTLADPSPFGSDRVGEGPFVDIVFNTKSAPFTVPQFEVRNLVVSRWSDGTAILDRRAAPYQGQSADAVELIVVDGE